ncbi:hypothetical protein CPB84DRAFT_1968126 [Gymnopilus junonius]|uniref:Uncharacterized protein n=1 Tax=Gymnopilus junonius TaxID=109634 RepID=A0A9P5N8I2_GYMJU|nr:hypothetical protein CPB84DRAFT_1968126 [Gymnopilus junonius]
MADMGENVPETKESYISHFILEINNPIPASFSFVLPLIFYVIGSAQTSSSWFNTMTAPPPDPNSVLVPGNPPNPNPGPTPAPMKRTLLAHSLLPASYRSLHGVGESSVELLCLLNAQDKHIVATAVPGPGAVVKINIQDVFIPGIFITIFSFLIAFFTLLFLILTVLCPASFCRTFALQGSILLLLALCLLVNLIVETIFIARRSAKVTASVGQVPVPQSVIEGVEQSGVKDAVILTWITFLFTIIASVILYIAASRVSARFNRELEDQHTSYPIGGGGGGGGGTAAAGGGVSEKSNTGDRGVGSNTTSTRAATNPALTATSVPPPTSAPSPAVISQLTLTLTLTPTTADTPGPAEAGPRNLGVMVQ